MYGGGTFAGYISNTANNDNGSAGSVLTVTSVSTGFINIGTQITGAGVQNGTVITGFTSGTQGGVGVYTVQIAPYSNYTQVLRQTAAGALTGSNANPLNTILSGLWGMAQEGDGTAKTAATSATVSIDLSAATAAAGNTFSVMGATLTCVASAAGVNQFNAGTGAALVSSLVSAINRWNNTSTLVAQATGWSTPKIQDAVFARVGSPTTTLEIMTRAGSAQYNTSTVATSGFTGGTFGPYTFSGGAGGCWGYISNPTGGFLPSAIGVSTYGPVNNTNTLAGFVGNATLGGEKIYIRSNKRIWGYGTSGFMGTTSMPSGNIANPQTYIVDDSTEWADGANPRIEFFCYPASSSENLMVNFVSNGSTRLLSKAYSDGTYGLKIIAAPIVQTAASHGIGINNGAMVEGIEIDAVTYASCAARIACTYAGASAYGYGAIAKNCLLRSKADQTFIATLTSNCTYELINIICDGTGMTVPLTRAVGFTSAQSYSCEFIFENLVFRNIPANSKLSAASDLWYHLSATFSNTTWGGVTGRGPFIPFYVPQKNGRYSQGFVSFGNRDFHFDGQAIYYDWDSSAGYPTCNAKLLDGTTPWVIKVILPRVATVITKSTVGELPRISKTMPTAALLAEAVRTIAVEMAIEQSLTFTKRDVYMQITYIQTDGSVKCIDTYDDFAGALDTSTATWSSESGGQVVFNPGLILHNKYKLQITTPTAIKAESEVSIYVRFTKSILDVGRTIFVDPEMSVA